MNIRDITEQNRRAWNEIAHIRGRRWAEKLPTDQLLSGVVLPPAAISLAQPIDRKRLLHLQCATGEESIAWAALGANVTAVDISDKQIDLARERAKEASLAIDFVAADVYDLPQAMQDGTFDVVYTGGGVMTWLPALEPWARTIARALKPNATFLVYDEHPFAQTLWVEDGKVVQVENYFQRGRVQEEPPSWSHFDDNGQATEPKFEFVWTLGEIVTALADAGMFTRKLEEFPTSEDQEYRFRGAMSEAAGLPGNFLLMATKTNT